MAVALETIWQSALGALCQRVGESRFGLWFKNIELIDLTDRVATLGVPSLFVRDWLEDHYRDVLEAVLSEHVGEPVSVAFRIEARLFQASRRREVETKREVLEELTRRPSAAVGQPPAVALRPEFRLDNFVVGHCNRLAYAAARQVAESANSTFNPLFVHVRVVNGR